MQWVRVVRHLGQFLADQLLNIRELGFFVEVAEGDGDSLKPGPACTPNAVHIGLRHIRQIIVDHTGQLVDIDSSGRNIRCDQYPQLFILKIVQRPLPGALGLVAVDRLGDHIALRQLPDHPVRPVLCARKYQRRVKIFCLQNVQQQILFVSLVHKIQILLDGLHRSGRGSDLDFLRVFQDFSRQLGDVRGHRG